LSSTGNWKHIPGSDHLVEQNQSHNEENYNTCLTYNTTQKRTFLHFLKAWVRMWIVRISDQCIKVTLYFIENINHGVQLSSESQTPKKFKKKSVCLGTM